MKGVDNSSHRRTGVHDGAANAGNDVNVNSDEDQPSTSGSHRGATLQALHRVSWKTIVQVLLLIFTVGIIIRTVAGLDLAELAHALGDATWWVVLLGLVVAQIPPVMQTFSTIGSSSMEHSFGPVYLLQLAQAYVGIAVPTGAARIAMEVRFLQKQGMAAGAALACGAIESLSGFIVEILLIGGLLLFTPQTLHFDLSAPSLPDWRKILLILVILAVILGVAAIAAPRHRHQLLTWVRKLLEDGRRAFKGLSSPRRLFLLFGGNLGAILANSIAIGVFAWALGTRVSFSDLIVIFITVSLLAGLLPVPGGIGVVASGITFGLIAAGMPEEPAFAAAALYRVATFYLPPIWGVFAFRWLERHELL